ncbi:hypothetical protein I3842_03G055500 [Carya illinoinensis]|uniref:Uncharacterized protein n=1 Tax=Carya illinoinensis TaxID=32201 RepID=A0A922JTW3_CARIL|nr:hypothetical protein I3842_03G055500 [Carya illinoinensis]
MGPQGPYQSREHSFQKVFSIEYQKLQRRNKVFQIKFNYFKHCFFTWLHLKRYIPLQSFSLSCRTWFSFTVSLKSSIFFLADEIDPSTYSFTTALKALQTRSGYYSWECSSPDGFALNSKWNEAEKYICNPLSGEVPMECLSAKTLSGRSFRNLTNRITMSAPLIHPSHSRQRQTKPSTSEQEGLVLQLPIPEKRTEGTTRDVGTQSTPPDLSSSSPSPVSTPSIIERSINRYGFEGADSPRSNAKTKPKQEVCCCRFFI